MGRLIEGVKGMGAFQGHTCTGTASYIINSLLSLLLLLGGLGTRPGGVESCCSADYEERD